MGGISTIVSNLEFQVTHTSIEEAAPPASGDINHHHFSRFELTLVVTRLVPPGLGGGDGAWLGLVNEGVAEAHCGCLIDREKKG
jgi:hypothetical protein